MSGQADSAAAVQLTDHDTLGAANDVSGVAGGGKGLGGAVKVVLEFIDLGDLCRFPCGIRARRAHGCVRARKEQTGRIGSRADDRPCIDNDVITHAAGVGKIGGASAAHVGIMRFRPQNAVCGRSALAISTVG